MKHMPTRLSTNNLDQLLYKRRPEPIMATGSGYATILLPEARECGCGRMVMLVVNRDGKTRCVCCDHDYVRGKGIPGDD